MSYKDSFLQVSEKHIVHNWKILISAVQQDCLMEMMKHVFYITHGMFDYDIHWRKKMERDFMTREDLKYNKDCSTSHRERDKGCFKKLVYLQKSSIVKQLQAQMK